jgi:phenylalanyl-tRNA synthetase beta chain
MAEMRTSMAASLLDTVAYNLNRKNGNNRLFEIGKVFEPDGKSGLAIERDILALAIEGDCIPQSWGNQKIENNFFVLKGVIEAFAAHCGLGAAAFSRLETACPLYGPERAAVAVSNADADNNPGINPKNAVVIKGTMGRVSAQIRKAFGIKTPVFYASLDVTEWLSTPKPLPKYDPLPKFPPLERDFSFVMPEALSSDAVKNEIKSVSTLIKAVRPFDLYRGENLSAETKSMTFSVEFRSPEKTLTDEDVAEACANIVSVMEKRHGAALRS